MISLQVPLPLLLNLPARLTRVFAFLSIDRGLVKSRPFTLIFTQLVDNQACESDVPETEKPCPSLHPGLSRGIPCGYKIIDSGTGQSGNITYSIRS